VCGDEWLTSRPGRFNPGKGPWYPLYRRLGGPQSRCGRCGEEICCSSAAEPTSSS